MSISSTPADTAEHLPAEAKSFADAEAVCDSAEAHYGHMRTLGAEDQHIADARSQEPYALNLASHIIEARDQYRADLADAREAHKAAMADTVSQKLELATIALMARSILEESPDARFMAINVSEDDDHEFVSSVSILDDDGESLGYVEPDDDPEWATHITSLSPSSSSWWPAFTPKPLDEPDDWLKIDLAAAASWSPGV